jgi:hypothetical protein
MPDLDINFDAIDDPDDEGDVGEYEYLDSVAGPRDLGPCCCCGATGPTVRNIVMLSRRAPVPGTGWGCLACDLPADGASYLACDRCLEEDRPPREVFSGYPAAKGRAPVDSLSPDVFDHDMAKHDEGD